MARISDPVLQKHWRTILHDRFDLYREVSLRGSTTASDTILLRDRLAHEDHFLTLLSSSASAATFAAAADGAHKLTALAEQGANETRKIFESEHAAMERLKASDAGAKRETWQTYLHASVAQRKKETDAVWDKLEKTGAQTIESLPEVLRAPAAKTYAVALGGVMKFITAAIDWLTNAWLKIVDFFKNLAKKIKEFVVNIGNWFKAAWNTIRVTFGGKNYAGLAAEPASDGEADAGEFDSGFQGADEDHREDTDFALDSNLRGGGRQAGRVGAD